jgi:hypothetical protein
MGKSKNELENEVDALFKLPLAEFTGARNALAAQLKKSGRGDEAVVVKALAKPSISAWAVNQLYWNHREAFDKLIESGEHFHKAQTSRGGGKVADMRAALDARRETLTHLSDLASSVLRSAGHNPSPDTIHRITTTLEALSVYASSAGGPRLGRLTHEVDPPGFESLASFVPGARTHPPAIAGGTEFTTTKTRRKAATDDDVRNLEETRKAKIAEARVLLQDAMRSLTEARVRARSLEAKQKEAQAKARVAEKQKSEAEERLKKAKAALEDATQRARSVEDDLEEALKDVRDAESAVGEGSKELESFSQA